MQSFNIGRSVSISKNNIDCAYPRGFDDTPTSSDFITGGDGDCECLESISCGCLLTYYTDHLWHAHYTLLLHSVMTSAFGPRQPAYPVTVDFDRKIRDFHVPLSWRMPMEEESAPCQDVSMYRWLILSAKEISWCTLCLFSNAVVDVDSL